MESVRIVVFAVIVLSAFFQCVELDASPYLVAPDEALWRGQTDWKGELKSAVIYFERPEAPTGCEEIDAAIDAVYGNGETDALRLGNACGMLVAVFRGDDFLAEETEVRKKFVADHEGFHLFAQLFGAGIDPNLLHSTASGSDSFFDGIIERVARTPNADRIDKDSACELIPIHQAMKGTQSYDYVERIVYQEWPAEYYAYTLHRRAGHTHESYVRLREVVGSVSSYSAGVWIGQLLEELRGPHWLNELDGGYSMIDLLGMACDDSYQPEARRLFPLSRMTL